jgi:NiFe hydrogenase small subunit HydA
MVISRRAFLKYCTASAAALGLGRFELDCLASALSSPSGPTVLWLQGSGCTGCSMSFLNYISGDAPHDAAEVLLDVINLAYHPNLMAPAGETSASIAQQCYDAGGYVLVVEGGVPTAFGGNACWAWTEGEHEVTFQEAVQHLSDRAAAVVCVGQCSSWGGIFAAPPNPTAVQSVATATGKTTINIPGCPPHPDWIVWAIAQLVAGQSIPTDSYGRPTAVFQRRVHERCPLRWSNEAHQWGNENLCKEELGCRGKRSENKAPCPDQLFNAGENWCIGAGSLCIGCVEPSFPGTAAFFEEDD